MSHVSTHTAPCCHYYVIIMFLMIIAHLLINVQTLLPCFVKYSEDKKPLFNLKIICYLCYLNLLFNSIPANYLLCGVLLYYALDFISYLLLQHCWFFTPSQGTAQFTLKCSKYPKYFLHNCKSVVMAGTLIKYKDYIPFKGRCRDCGPG